MRNRQVSRGRVQITDQIVLAQTGVHITASNSSLNNRYMLCQLWPLFKTECCQRKHTLDIQESLIDHSGGVKLPTPRSSLCDGTLYCGMLSFLEETDYFVIYLSINALSLSESIYQTLPAVIEQVDAPKVVIHLLWLSNGPFDPFQPSSSHTEIIRMSVTSW